jgi:hypothetical protein
MDLSDLDEEADQARLLREDEADREREAGLQGRRPQLGQDRSVFMQPERGPVPAPSAVPKFSSTDLGTLKEEYPFLAKFSDEFLSTQTLETLLKLESTKLKMQKMEESKKSGDRLGANKAKLQNVYTEVRSGRDNRSTLLHEARYLPGAGVSVTRQWLQARKVLGQDSMQPVGCYDMASIGLDGLVSSKGWVEVHDPGSMNISVQMFNTNSVTTKEGGLSDVSELKLAVRTMRAAVGMAMPWNKSVEALENFLIQTDFCANDTGKMDKRAKLLTQFIDQVLRANAVRWRDEEPFLTSGKLQSTWASFFNARSASASASVSFKKPTQGNFGRNPDTFYGKDLLIATGACARYNNNKCIDQNKKECSREGKTYKHICLFASDRSKPLIICGKDHPKMFHK